MAASALLASILSLALAFWFFERYYKRRLKREIDEIFESYLERLRETLAEEASKAGDLMEKKVQHGLLAAVSNLPSPEVLQKTTDSVVKTGVDLVEAGLSTFLGNKSRKR